MEPVELSGELVAIEALSAEHAPGLLAAADAEEVFAWLPYPRLADLEGRGLGSPMPSPTAMQIVGFRSPSSTPRIAL